MTFIQKASLIFGIIGIFTVSIFAVTLKRGEKEPRQVFLPQHSQAAAPKAIPTPDVVSVHSPDGTKQIIMRKRTQADNSVVYFFFTDSVPGATGTLFFSKTIGGKGSMKVPLNAWSPANAYLFLQEDEEKFTDIYVFKADGSNFNNGQQYLSVSSLFAGKITNYIFQSATGWDSDTLLHVITTTNGKDRGPSFWFDVPGGSFIQLAR